jgi:hypothetical protein
MEKWKGKNNKFMKEEMDKGYSSIEMRIMNLKA